MPRAAINSKRTGSVFLKDFDKGIVESLGATVTGNDYFLDVIGVGNTRVIWANPEQVFQDFVVPAIVIRRDDISPALSRLMLGGMQYAQGVSQSVVVDTVSGFTHKETKPQAYPFDISYTIQCFARLQNQAVRMLGYVLRIYPPYCLVRVVDSVGEERTYQGYMESIADLDEVTDAVEKMSAFSVSLRVEAELDLVDPAVETLVTQVQRNMQVL